MGRTCGEPNEIELTAIGVKLNGRCVGDHCDKPAAGFVGADVIANSAMVLYGAAHALFGFRTDLHGVHVYGSPAKGLKDGARHRFVHLGRHVELRVVCRKGTLLCKQTTQAKAKGGWASFVLISLALPPPHVRRARMGGASHVRRCERNETDLAADSQRC